MPNLTCRPEICANDHLSAPNHRRDEREQTRARSLGRLCARAARAANSSRAPSSSSRPVTRPNKQTRLASAFDVLRSARTHQLSRELGKLLVGQRLSSDGAGQHNKTTTTKQERERRATNHCRRHNALQLALGRLDLRRRDELRMTKRDERENKSTLAPARDTWQTRPARRRGGSC